MRKMNNGRFRPNNGGSIYSLNYKFDSISAAGKFSGTALELIKKYNELAKEAHSNGDYVEMEVFRQYAEHYRKIVTEINERKNQNRENAVAENTADAPEVQQDGTQPADNGLVETQALEPAKVLSQSNDEQKTEPDTPKTTVRRRRNFTIVEVTAKDNAGEGEAPVPETSAKPRRRVLRKRISATDENTNVSEA